VPTNACTELIALRVTPTAKTDREFINEVCPCQGVCACRLACSKPPPAPHPALPLSSASQRTSCLAHHISIQRATTYVGLLPPT
jgi:hypothetical protein